MTALNTREQQARETRRKLVDTALALFSKHGFDGTSMKTLAREAGVAQGLVYHYFESKEALLWAILESRSFAPDLPPLLAEVADRPVREALVRVGRRFDAVLVERRALLRLLVREAPVNPEVARLWQRLVREGGESLCRFLEARAQSGDLRPHDPRTALQMLLFPLLMRHVLGETEANPGDFIEGMVDLLLAGLLPTGEERG